MIIDEQQVIGMIKHKDVTIEYHDLDGQSDRKNDMNKIQLVEKIELKAYGYINFENLDHYVEKKKV